MKNKIIYVLIILSLFSFNFLNVKAEAAPSTLEMKEKSSLYYFDKGTDYIHGYNFYQKELTDGTYAYCIGTTKMKVPAGKTLTLKGENTDIGLDYLIKNGYPNKSITGDNKKDYYITQAAIWKYLDETTGTTNWHNIVFDANSTGMELEVYKLLNGAKQAQEEKREVSIAPIYINKEMTLNQDYFVSELIKVSAINTSGKYAVNLKSAPEGTIIKNSQGEEQLEYDPNEGFYVYVPASSIKDGEEGTIKIRLTAVGISYKTYIYTANKEEYQDIIPVKSYEVVSDLVSSDFELTYKKDSVAPITTKVKISKQDITTKKELSGATLTIKNSKDEIVAEWVSTNEPHYIEALEPGEYNLTEKIAPDGYALSQETIKFTVTNDGKITEVIMYNTPYTEVPITDLNTSKLVTIGAIILMTLGMGLVIYYVKVKK